MAISIQPIILRECLFKICFQRKSVPLCEDLLSVEAPKRSENTNEERHEKYAESGAHCGLQGCFRPGTLFFTSNVRNMRHFAKAKSCILHISSTFCVFFQKYLFIYNLQCLQATPSSANLIVEGFKKIDMLLDIKSTEAEAWGLLILDLKCIICNRLIKDCCRRSVQIPDALRRSHWGYRPAHLAHVHSLSLPGNEEDH